MCKKNCNDCESCDNCETLGLCEQYTEMTSTDVIYMLKDFLMDMVKHRDEWKNMCWKLYANHSSVDTKSFPADKLDWENILVQLTPIDEEDEEEQKF
jgi:hypothetical protein